MNLKENKFLTVWLVVVALVGAVLGFLLFKSYGAYKQAKNSFTSARVAVENLEKEVPYPKKENLDQKKALVEKYEQAVSGLQGKLVTWQRPLRRMTDIEFQNKLKKNVEDIKGDAEKGGAKLPDSFSLGMSRYITGLPQPQACPMLDYQLDSLTFLADVIISSGAKSIDSWERDPLPVEAGNVPAEGEEPMLQRFPLEIAFTATDQDSIEKVINAISNTDTENFYHIIRLLRLENSEKMGPTKTPRESFSAPEDQGGFEDFGGLGEPLETQPDAEYVLGEEDIKVFIKVELVHFLEPASEEAAEEEGAEEAVADKAAA